MPRTKSTKDKPATKATAPKTTPAKAALSKDNMRGARLPDDVLGPFDELVNETGLDAAEVLRRLVRLALPPVIKNKNLLLSKEASHFAGA